MKHLHVIYNSSEKNRSGGVGFGVRSATAGISPQLLTAMEQNGIFSFKESNVAISPSALIENPDKITETPASYFFQVLALGPQEKAYVLGRKVAVGFDYTFYLNGRPGRLGNYVVDSYVFSSCPDYEDFEVLLESPAPGSRRFIPADPAPKPGNEEMRSISVGHCPDLPQEDVSLKAESRPAITPQAISLLFAFLQSRKEGKPLLVKSDAKASAPLMAALAIMMPQEHIDEITFVSNYNEQGRKNGFNIFFINENYRFEIFPNQWVVFDARKGERFDSEEANLFEGTVAEYGASGNYVGIRALVRWCLSSIYETSKSYPRAAQKAMFDFVNAYDKFQLLQLASDSQLRRLMRTYLADHPKEGSKIQDSLQQMLDENPADIEKWLEMVLQIGSAHISEPIDVSEVWRENKRAINDYVFRDSTTFIGFYNRFSNYWQELLDNVIDSSRFAQNESFLSDFNGKQWSALYPHFLGHRNIDKKYFLQKLLECRYNIRREERDALIIKEIPDPKDRVTLLLSYMREHADDDRVINAFSPLLIESARPLGHTNYDFFEIFPNKIENTTFTPLYTFSLETARLDYADDIREFDKKLKQLLSSPLGNGWLEGRDSNPTLSRLYDALKKRLYTQEMSYKEGLILADRICGVKSIENFGLLRIVLNHETCIPAAHIRNVWKIAEELDDRNYLKILVPEYLKAGSPEIMREIIHKEYLSRKEALEYALQLGKERKGLTYVMTLTDMIEDAQGKLDFLVTECGFSDEQAMSLLERYQPEAHKKILKLRKPSIWSRLSGMFKKQDKNAEEGDPVQKNDAKSLYNNSPASVPPIPSSNNSTRQKVREKRAEENANRRRESDSKYFK